jgi:signal transduction histidine kinase
LAPDDQTWQVPFSMLDVHRAFVGNRAFTGRVFSAVAHNLGTSVYLIRSYLSRLADKDAQGKWDARARHRAYGILKQQASHMDGVVDGVTSLAGRTISVTFEPTDPAQVVYDLVEAAKEVATPHGKSIAFERVGGASAPFLTDKAKLYEIVQNLVSNALKYSPEGKKIQVTVEMGMAGARFVRVAVRDEGIGVPAEERDLIFEPFVRGQRALREYKDQGLGLGLYISRTYARLLPAGRLELISREAESGSTFQLYVEEPGTAPEQGGSSHAHPADR